MKIKPLKEIMEYVDYCSGVPDLNLNSCCKQHDEDYRKLGKWKADWDFMQCGFRRAQSMKTLGGLALTYTVSITYYIGVTLFGWLPYYRAQKKGIS